MEEIIKQSAVSLRPMGIQQSTGEYSELSNFRTSELITLFAMQKGTVFPTERVAELTGMERSGCQKS